MTANTSPTTNRSSSPRRYRIIMYGFLAVGFVGYIAGLRVDAPLAALGIYWVGFLGFLGIWKGSWPSYSVSAIRGPMRRWRASSRMSASIRRTALMSQTKGLYIVASTASLAPPPKA